MKSAASKASSGIKKRTLKKYTRKNVKERAVKRQPCCGLWACLKVAGKKVKNAKDIESFRQTCIEHKLVGNGNRGGRWAGGTTATDRQRILDHYKIEHQYVPVRAKTLNQLMKEKEVINTKKIFLVTVTKHVLVLFTNNTAGKSYFMDQRGTRMKFKTKDKGNKRQNNPMLAKSFRKKLVSVLEILSPESEIEVALEKNNEPTASDDDSGIEETNGLAVDDVEGQSSDDDEDESDAENDDEDDQDGKQDAKPATYEEVFGDLYDDDADESDAENDDKAIQKTQTMDAENEDQDDKDVTTVDPEIKPVPVSSDKDGTSTHDIIVID